MLRSRSFCTSHSGTFPRRLVRIGFAVLFALSFAGTAACSEDAGDRPIHSGLLEDDELPDGATGTTSADSDDDGHSKLDIGGQDDGVTPDNDGDNDDVIPPDDDDDDDDSEDDDGDDDTGTTGDDDEDCDDTDEVVLYLSPDDSNSMSSPVQVRERVLGQGSLTLRDVNIRPWEFMNYYRFPYPAAEDGTVRLAAELADGGEPEEAGNVRYAMQLAVSSPYVAPADRAPINLTLVLDSSGSMSGEPFELLQESCRAIAASLKAGDNISLVEWDTENNIRLENHVVEGPDDPTLLDTIDALVVGGGTNLHAGLVTGYSLANNVWDRERINRIVLISDGGANVGIVEEDIIAEHAQLAGSDGIYMVGVGVGDANYNDELMDAVTDAGKGASAFINEPEEAWKVFGRDFLATVGVAARDVQVELALPPGFVLGKFSGEDSGTDPQEVEPQHIAPNDAVVFYQEVETCAPDLIDEATEFSVTARFKDARTFENREVSQTFRFSELLDSEPNLLLKGAAIFGYTEALRAYKKAQTAEDRRAALAPAITSVKAAVALSPEDSDLLEVREILLALYEGWE